VAYKIPYVYDFITKLCRQQADVIQNHENKKRLQYWIRRSPTRNIRTTLQLRSNTSSDWAAITAGVKWEGTICCIQPGLFTQYARTITQ